MLYNRRPWSGMRHITARPALATALCLAAIGCGGGNSQLSSYAEFAQFVTTTIDQAQTAPDLPPSICVAIGRRGAPFYTHCVGNAALAPRVAASPETVYQIASLSKQFTAAAIMQLNTVNPPAVSLDGLLTDYVPQMDSHPAITIRELLNHTTGLFEYTNLPQADEWGESGVTPDEFVAALVPTPQVFMPESAFQYCDTNYYFLGLIIQAASGDAYDNYLRQQFFDPFKLSFTGYGPVLGVLNAAGYKLGPGQTLVPAEKVDVSALFASGGLSSNVLDLVKWDWLLLGGSILPQAAVEQMITPSGVPDYSTGIPSTYGFGLFSERIYHRRLVSHTGAVSGFFGFNATFTDDGWSIALLTNIDVDDDPQITNLGPKIIKAVCRPDSYFRNWC